MAVITRAVFDQPSTGRTGAIFEAIRALVRGTAAGESIRIALFLMTGRAGRTLADELAAAHARNVDVRLVVDPWQAADPAVTALRRVLGSDRSARSWIHTCSKVSPEGNTGACIGTKGQHNKFFLFSSTGGASEVVVQASANATDQLCWNNSLTVVGAPALYRAYGSYFDDLAAERRTADYYRVTTTALARGTITSYFFPRAGEDASTDTIVELLEPVGSDAVVRVAMSEWDRTRIAIADRLRTLADAGTRLRVVHGVMDEAVRQRLAGLRTELRRLDSRQLPGRVHSKYVLVERGEAGAGPWVVTGSPNFTHTSLRRNDEALLRLDLPTVYEQFLTDFATMWDAAQPSSP
jgi:phosphatidylserine/phosphatidylglycerophosphate/cardiolipin synthase-like enzyme